MGLDIVSQPSNEFVHLHFRILQNFVQQSRPKSLAGMNWHHSGAAIGMPHKMMAAFDANHNKTGSPQCGSDFTATESRQTWHI